VDRLPPVERDKWREDIVTNRKFRIKISWNTCEKALSDIAGDFMSIGNAVKAGFEVVTSAVEDYVVPWVGEGLSYAMKPVEFSVDLAGDVIEFLPVETVLSSVVGALSEVAEATKFSEVIDGAMTLTKPLVGAVAGFVKTGLVFAFKLPVVKGVVEVAIRTLNEVRGFVSDVLDALGLDFLSIILAFLDVGVITDCLDMQRHLKDIYSAKNTWEATGTMLGAGLNGVQVAAEKLDGSGLESIKDNIKRAQETYDKQPFKFPGGPSLGQPAFQDVATNQLLDHLMNNKLVQLFIGSVMHGDFIAEGIDDLLLRNSDYIFSLNLDNLPGGVTEADQAYGESEKDLISDGFTQTINVIGLMKAMFTTSSEVGRPLAKMLHALVNLKAIDMRNSLFAKILDFLGLIDASKFVLSFADVASWIDAIFLTLTGTVVETRELLADVLRNIRDKTTGRDWDMSTIDMNQRLPTVVGEMIREMGGTERRRAGAPPTEDTEDGGNSFFSLDAETYTLAMLSLKATLAFKETKDLRDDKALSEKSPEDTKGDLGKRLALRSGKILLQVGRGFNMFRKECPDALIMVFASDCFAVVVDIIVALAAYLRSSSAESIPAASLSPSGSEQPTVQAVGRSDAPRPASQSPSRTNHVIGIPYVIKGVLSISFNAAAQIWIEQIIGDSEPGDGYQYNPFKIVKVYAEGLTNIGKGLYFLKGKGRNRKVEIALIGSWGTISKINKLQIAMLSGTLPDDFGQDLPHFETHNGEPTFLNR